MAIRRRCFGPLVALVTAAYLVSASGCAVARSGRSDSRPPLRTQTEAASQVPAANAVSHAQASGDVALAAYAVAAPSDQGPLLAATADDVAAGGFDVGQVVRGQNDHGYGPIREFLISPYTIGAIFVAALVVPAAIEGGEDQPAPLGP